MYIDIDIRYVIFRTLNPLPRLRQMLLDDLQVDAKFCETSEERRRRGTTATAEEEEAETDKTARPHSVHNLQSERLAEKEPRISGNISCRTLLPRYLTYIYQVMVWLQ